MTDHGPTVTPTQRVLDAVAVERHAQDQQWGGPQHDNLHSQYDWIVFCTKFLGKCATLAMQIADIVAGKRGMDYSMAEEELVELRHRHVQVAALHVAAAEAIDRRLKRDVHR